MTSPPILVPIKINDALVVDAMIDTGCLCFGVIRTDVVDRLNLQRSGTASRSIVGIHGDSRSSTVVNLAFTISSYSKPKIKFYELLNIIY